MDEQKHPKREARKRFRSALSEAIRNSGKSRWAIAAEISESTGRTLTKDMLDKCTALNEDYALRAEHLAAFCSSTGTLKPFDVLLGPLGAAVIDSRSNRLRHLSALEDRLESLQKAATRLRAELGIIKP